MELEAWSGDWGLPSIDSECLKILAFAKFSGAPLTQVLGDVIKLTLLKKRVPLMSYLCRRLTFNFPSYTLYIGLTTFFFARNAQTIHSGHHLVTCLSFVTPEWYSPTSIA